MLKTTRHPQPYRLSEAAMLVPRQLWLAGLGAAILTRDWVQSDAGDAFKSLVKQGSAVESRALRTVGHRLETSVSAANTMWKETRRTLESTVKQAADTAVSFTRQALPKSLPKIELPLAQKPAKRVAKPAKRAKRGAKAVGEAKRSAGTATRRAAKAATRRG